MSLGFVYPCCAWCDSPDARIVPEVSGEDAACDACIELLRAEIQSNTPPPSMVVQVLADILAEPGAVRAWVEHGNQQVWAEMQKEKKT